jgi:hypothetical protein
LKTGIVKQGLPPFITSLFLYTFQYEFNCLGDSTHFYVNTVEKIDSVIWDFGDETTSDLETSHIYQNTGDYTVTLTKIVNGKPETLLKNWLPFINTDYIYNPIQACTMRYSGHKSTDGLSLFNLELANDAICLENEDYEVFYYHN